MTYSIGEVSEMLAIPISTLRYYDKKVLLPLIKRTNGNIRVFSDMDVRWLKLLSVGCFSANMKICEEITPTYFSCRTVGTY